MNTLPILKTKRLTLRAIDFSDLDDMFEYARRENVGPMAGWMPHQNKEETMMIIQHMRENMLTEDNIGVFSIIFDGKMIGTVGLHKYHKRYASCEMGYVLSPDYWGLGIMPEACKEIIRWVFEEFGIYRLECGHYDFNERSKRVIEKLGFKFEGASRKKAVKISDGQRADICHYSILKDEYETLKWK